MRRDPKFKIYVKSKTFLLSCPSKLLKFKHAKWKFYKKILKKRLKRKFFFNVTSISPRLKTFDKKKLFFKKGLKIKRELYQIFDSSIKLQKIKKLLKNQSGPKFNSLFFLNNSILKFEYNLGILLFRLNIFSNIFASRKFIDNKEVLVNSKPISHNYFVKKGDIISFNTKIINIKNIFEKQIKLPVFLPFIEIDFYTGCIVIVKDLHELSLEDITLFNAKHFDLPKLRYILCKY